LGTTVNPGKIIAHNKIKKQSQHYWSPKIMGSLSWEAKPVVFTFPSISYYFRDGGINLGASMGMVF
jgi:hypothetical protein